MNFTTVDFETANPQLLPRSAQLVELPYATGGSNNRVRGCVARLPDTGNSTLAMSKSTESLQPRLPRNQRLRTGFRSRSLC